LERWRSHVVEISPEVCFVRLIDAWKTPKMQLLYSNSTQNSNSKYVATWATLWVIAKCQLSSICCRLIHRVIWRKILFFKIQLYTAIDGTRWQPK
jgi:hypothetical protein